MKNLFITVFLLLCAALSAPAQTDRKAAQARLKQYFEGKRVTLKIDMPAARAGVDLQLNKPAVLDFSKHSKRLGEYGISLRTGDSPVVTEVEVSGDEIEFQLDGGGYGSPGDSSSEPSVPSYPTKAPKSQYEKDLELEQKTATDSNRLRYIRKELDRERDRRDRNYNRDLYEYNRAKQYRDEFIAQKRPTRGSRFNLKFGKGDNTAAVTPDDLMKFLAEYVDFSNLDGIRIGQSRSTQKEELLPVPGKPYTGDWSNGRGERLRIANGLIQFGSGNQMEYREVFRMASTGVYAIEILNPSGSIRRFVSMAVGNAEIKLSYYNTLEDLQNGINRKGEETWSK